MVIGYLRMNKAGGKSCIDLEIDISGARCEHLIAFALLGPGNKITAIISFNNIDHPP